jgi:hypothetical protein
MDEVFRNLAPPLGAGLLTLVIYLWARGVHRRTRTKRDAQPAE